MRESWLYRKTYKQSRKQEETDGSSSVIDEEKRFISGQEEEESSDSTAMTDDREGRRLGRRSMRMTWKTVKYLRNLRSPR